jgi:hypothetical protein
MKQVKSAVSALSQVSKALANQEPVANHYVMGSTTIDLLQNWSFLNNAEGNAKALLIDDLYANGYKPHHFVDMKEKEDKQGVSFRDSILLHIVKGWKDPVAEKLYFADPKTLKVSELALQSDIKERARKAYNNMKESLKNRIAKGDQVGKKAPSAKTVLALRKVKEATKYLEDVKEGYSGMLEDIKALKSLKILTVVKDTK